jgi:hypothetical protein
MLCRSCHRGYNWPSHLRRSEFQRVDGFQNRIGRLSSPVLEGCVVLPTGKCCCTTVTTHDNRCLCSTCCIIWFSLRAATSASTDTNNTALILERKMSLTLIKSSHKKQSVLFCVLIVCKCVLYYFHRVSTQLKLRNIS